MIINEYRLFIFFEEIPQLWIDGWMDGMVCI